MGRDTQSILLVDDDRSLRSLLATALMERGFAVLEASNGFSALRLARRHQPAAIVLDLLLPEVSGQAVLDELKRDPLTRDIPVVVMSGHPELLRKGWQTGADAVYPKPFDPETLEDEVVRLARSRGALALVR
jgi:twitching motility two-component system response regulator PilH